MTQMFKAPETVLPDYSDVAKIPQLFLAAKNARRTQDRADRNAATQESYSRLKEARDAELHRVAIAKEERAQRDQLASAGLKAYTLAANGQTGAANLFAAAHGMKVDSHTADVPPLEAPMQEPVRPDNAYEGPLQAPLNHDIFGAANGAYEKHAKDTLAGKPPAPTLTGQYSVAGQHRGMLSPGNIDLTNRPDVTNPDGTHSSVRSMSINVDGAEVLVPTVSEDGRVMSDEEAIQQYMKTGRHLGKFSTPEEATAYAQQLHLQQEGAAQPAAPVYDKAAVDKLYGDRASAVAGHEQAADVYSKWLPQRATEVHDYEARKKAAEAHPQISLHMPDGGGDFTFDPKEQQAAKRSEAAQQAAQLRASAAQLPPQMAHIASQMLMTASLLETGLANADKAPLTNAVSQQAGAENAQALAGINNTASFQRTKYATDHKKVGKGKGPLGLDPNGFRIPNTDERTAESGFTTMMNAVLQQGEYRKNLDQFYKNKDMLDEAMSQNPAMHTMLGGAFAKMAQGWTGVLSDADMNVFWHNLGGVGERTANGINMAINGLITDGKKTQVEDALKTLMKNNETRRQSLARGLIARIKGSTYRGREQVALDTFFGTDENGNPNMRAENLGGRTGTAKQATPASAAQGSSERRQLESLSDDELRKLAQ